VLVGTSGSLVTAGHPDKGAERLEVPLLAGSINFGSLILFGDDFSEEDRITAISLASHAVVALDNARLHRIVERQALIDGLTGLANRRQCEETLADELARVERFGGSLAVVVADLDWFKDVNDRHGHPAGDSVLSDFAALLQETVRDVDLMTLGWGGVRSHPARDRSHGGAQVAERIRVPWPAGLFWPGTGLRSPSQPASESLPYLRPRQPRSSSQRPMPPCIRRSEPVRIESRRRPSRSHTPDRTRPIPAVSVGKVPLKGYNLARRDNSAPNSGASMQVETPSIFAKVIQDHLELKERNARLEESMPIGHYKAADPFDNHPLFKTEEQARLEETMDGEDAAVGSESPVLAWPGEETVEQAAGPEPEEGLWGRSRDFDWGD
jgi:hypothetical protein